jgi:hypothetical protein
VQQRENGEKEREREREREKNKVLINCLLNVNSKYICKNERKKKSETSTAELMQTVCNRKAVVIRKGNIIISDYFSSFSFMCFLYLLLRFSRVNLTML